MLGSMDAVTKHTTQVRRVLGIGFSVLVFCLLAYWILAMAVYFFVPQN
jgi:hypothetical protein